MLAGTEKRIEDFRVAATLVIRYVAAGAIGEEVESEDRVLDQLRAVPAAMRAMGRSSTRDCVVRALSLLRLHYPKVDMSRINFGVLRGVTEADERAAKEYVEPVADDVVADLDLDEE